MSDTKLPIGEVTLYPSEWQKPIEVAVDYPTTFRNLNKPDGVDKKKQPGRMDDDSQSVKSPGIVDKEIPGGYLSFDDTKFNRVGSLQNFLIYREQDRNLRLHANTENAVAEAYNKLASFFRVSVKRYVIHDCIGTVASIDRFTDMDNGSWMGNIKYTLVLSDNAGLSKTVDISLPVHVVEERHTKQGNEKITNEVLRVTDSLGRRYDLSNDGLDQLFEKTEEQKSYIVHL